jgi:hypothetical protein
MLDLSKGYAAALTGLAGTFSALAFFVARFIPEASTTWPPVANRGET